MHDGSVVLPQAEDLEFFGPSYASFHFRSQRPVCFRKSFKISQLKMKTLLSPTASILSACPVVLMDQGKYEQPEEMHRQASTLAH